MYAVALVTFGTLFPAPGSAQVVVQSENAVAETSAYARYVEAVSPDELHEATFAATLNQLRQAYEEDANFVLLEKQCSGIIDEVLSNQNVNDLLRAYHWKEAEAIRSLLLDISSEYLTEDQAQSAADAYTSPIGRKLIMAVGSHVNFRSTFNDAAYSGDGTVERESYDRDQRASIAGAINALTKEEIAQFGEMVAGSDWFAAIQKMAPAINQARFEVLNSDLIPGFQDQLNAAMEEAMTAHLETCE